MYPTVCTLMGLWRFVMAEKATWEDATAETQASLESVRLEDLQKQETWAQLATIVRIQPMDDVLPVRAKYDGKQYRIGLNHLTGDSPMWYTLADCIASKLLTGRVPKVIQAIRFQPQGVQKGLRPINIAGNPAYRIDPNKDDFYQRLMELRIDVKDNSKKRQSRKRTYLDDAETELKIRSSEHKQWLFN